MTWQPWAQVCIVEALSINRNGFASQEVLVKAGLIDLILLFVLVLSERHVLVISIVIINLLDIDGRDVGAFGE